MKSYQPSNKVPATGWVWLLALSILGGVVVGGITALIARWVYLLLIFPGLMGLTSGGCTAMLEERPAAIAVQRGKIRNPWVGFLFAALTGAITYGSFHGGEYLFSQQKFAQQIEAELGQEMNAEESAELMNLFLKDETGWGYLKFSAQQGVNIGRVGRSGDGITLNEPLTWAYWLIELALIELISVTIAKAAVDTPFCEACDQWYARGQRIGTVTDDQSEVFLNTIKAEQIVQAATHIQAKTVANPRLEVDLRHCPGCVQGEVVLEIQRYSENKKGEGTRSPVLLGMLSHRQSKQLTQAISTSSESDHQSESDMDHES